MVQTRDPKIITKEIYESEAPKLYGYLVKKAGADVAQDILQEAFARLFTQLTKSADIVNVRAYLFQIARHLLYHESSASKKFSTDETILENYAAVESSTPEERELLETLAEAVASLEGKDKEIFELRWNLGLTQVEIAATLNKSERQIRRDLEKITTRLRQFFREKGWDDTPEGIRV